MKKLFCLILGLIFMIPITAKADMGSPQILTYKATPVSKEGAKYFESAYNPDKVKGTFAYNEELTAYEEIKRNGKVYVNVCDKNDKCGFVLITDLKLTKGATDLSSYKGDYKARVFDKDGVEVYEGPGYIYKKTGTKIPYGTEIVTSSYKNNEGTWLKVKYNGLEGFIDSDGGAVMVLHEGGELIKDTNEVVTEFYLSNPWEDTFAYKVNGKYVISEEVTPWLGKFKNKTEFKAIKDINLYKNYGYSDDQVKIGTIKKGTIVKFIYDASYQGSEDFYVEADGKKGWISFDFEDTKNYFENYDEEAPVESLYPSPVEAKGDITTPESTGDVVTPEKEDGDVVVPKAEDDDDFFAGFTKKQIILISAIGAGVIVLTAVITIILVNKKKNKNNITPEVDNDKSVQE